MQPTGHAWRRLVEAVRWIWPVGAYERTSIMGPQLVNKRLVLGFFAGICALVFGLPSISLAQDPVEKLRQTLRDPLPITLDPKLTADRTARIKKILPKIETISQR